MILQKKAMEALIKLLFNQFISQETSPILPLLYKLKPFVLTSSLPLQANDIQLLQYLIAKNFVSYSSAHLQVRLQSHSVLFYQRIHKLKAFANAHLHPQFSKLLSEFIANDLFPVQFSTKSIQSLQGRSPHPNPIETKGKKKKKQEEVMVNSHEVADYSRLINECSDSSQQKQEVECMINLGELTQLMRFRKIEEHLGARSKEYLKNFTYKEGEEHLESLSFLQMYRIVKENRPKAQAIQQIMYKCPYCRSVVKEQYIEDYVLQTFRKYDAEVQKDGTPFSKNILLVFNLIKKFPLSSEKELLEKSLLPVLVLRKCLNLLVAEGLINYYPQNIRSTLYRITSYSEIEGRFVNHIAQALLNLHEASSNRELGSEQLLKMECMIINLDDILLIFGY